MAELLKVSWLRIPFYSTVRMKNVVEKKLRYGDVITIPSEELEITIVAPTTNEIEEHQKSSR